ncbi:TIGR01841 family phasin [Orrella sp. NBD-18]|uniref:TIGR01841 family phasin n=1 Tax=Sheuella amnicola TaxID=2707330 RepID=A0A6B2R146_9BURK|nr:TIGR01841 family phasin [Sheuella amnicola]NDY83069.1 TIGR01841 family phasin [Sheuella amnicola]
MSAIPQQVLNSQKAAIDTLVAVQNSVFNGFEKLVDLNLKVIKATIDDVSEKSQQVAAVKDAQEAVALSSSLVQPGTDKAVAYSKHVYDIISAVQADLAKLGETQVAEAQKHINDAVEQMTKNAPAGSENAVAMLKSSLAQASGAFDAMTKAAKQATEAAEKNLTAATSATLKAAGQAAEAAKTATRARRAA